MSVGSVIQNGRTKLGMSRAEFAKVIGVNSVIAYKWEMGEMNIDRAHLKKICETLNINYGELSPTAHDADAAEMDAILLAWRLADEDSREIVRLALKLKSLKN